MGSTAITVQVRHNCPPSYLARQGHLPGSEDGCYCTLSYRICHTASWVIWLDILVRWD